MRSILPLGLLLLANTTQAQDQPTLLDPQHGFFGRPYFENSSDNAEFMQFHASCNGMRASLPWILRAPTTSWCGERIIMAALGWCPVVMEACWCVQRGPRI